MYGYIRTHVPELKVREQEYYQAVYCGLCRTMGKCTGQCSRLTLSYDMTFFALVRMALVGERITVRPRWCFGHSLRRRLMAEPSDTLRLCAYLSAILAYHKVRDDRADETGFKKAGATLVTPYLASIRRRACRKGYDETDERVAAILRDLSELEASRPPSVDAPADLFGDLMATLLSVGLDERRARLATTIGRHVGRWTYILDAADDFEEDVRRGRYNPFVCLYQDPTIQTIPEDRKAAIRRSLLADLRGLEQAFDLLETEDDRDLAGVLSNILYEAMPREIDRILELGIYAPDAEWPEGVPRPKKSRRKQKRRGTKSS